MRIAPTYQFSGFEDPECNEYEADQKARDSVGDHNRGYQSWVIIAEDVLYVRTYPAKEGQDFNELCTKGTRYE